MMKNEKPGGHGERSVAVGTIDMAIWDLVSKIEKKPLFQMIAERYEMEQLIKKYLFMPLVDITGLIKVYKV